MTARQRLIHNARDLKGFAAATAAIVLVVAAAIALIALVIRGDAKGLGDWGLLIGLFITAATGLLTEARQGQRATDPGPDTRVSTTVETETTP